MIRISESMLLQRVNNDLVILDEASGEEVILDLDEMGRMLHAITVLFPDPGSPFVPPSQVRIALLKWLEDAS